MPDNSLRKIGLMDHMGFSNLGDAAIQEAIIANIRRRIAGAAIVGFSLNPGDTEARHGIPSYPITWSYPGRFDSKAQGPGGKRRAAALKRVMKRIPVLFSFLKPIHDLAREAAHLLRSYRVLKSLDLFVVSGGGQLCELWRGPWSHPYNVFKFAVLAKLAGVKLYFVNVGAGPLKHPLSKFFSKWAVRLADYASFRDQESKELVSSLGVKKDLAVFPDPVYALYQSNYVPAETPSSSGRLVGINPIGYCDPRIWPRSDAKLYERYLDELTAFCSWLLDKQYKLRIFSGDILVDHLAVEDLKERISTLAPPGGIEAASLAPELGLQELLGQMSSLDYIVTSKFHGVVFSHLLRKPVIALSYHCKIDHLMQKVGHSRYCLDIERFEAGSLIEAFGALTENARDLSLRFQRAASSFATELKAEFNSLFGEQS